ncbi:ABC transporter ATP-binding protein [Cerasicoccus arenae]|uniref:Lipoprotein-releasing system ATP-binding protein LolD n=1 Tax=Cerasicoccus arenae TaxID=424488 RepID=A0A8J3D8X5_9BACT|nr:ABC transporter ATP-binding protein [Cerasicoccus arenae]MBK1856922.1 ABC transporter ATP-binding protein [Cerasicoccus arenae]GHB89862.1 lipoprotein-releasing system ATP-binding protein LolD [Cerasicoccus arenae]
MSTETPVPTPASQPVLRAENLHRSLGEGESRVHVLRGINLQLKPAMTYSVAGPSGCGKSTMLYLLGLLDRQDKGQIWIRGELMSDASDAERTAARSRHIGFVFQFHFLLPEFSAAENVMLPMKKLGARSPEEMRSRAEYLLGLVGLGAKADRLATHLSGGEQQRVAIARSLANDPALLLADEPTGNLDVANSNMVFDLLQRLTRETGQAILMVTHNPELAERTDARLRMQDGQFVV